ncbi:hypothetical protein GGX14DRAFT_443098 [Mycena pura]|uniref:Uncharacterized protein n=1 Tax=Mycena pura TaxID=153505 RepID=A0AAD6YI96_9AGAR|nr:hypothetical protein GGX14DRAFT_443098 [Mycena pura]
MWGWEHSTVFALKYQTWVSLVITATVTTLGTIYYATLVFLTQKLSARKNLVQWQFLTVTHDIAAAWTGIGSAISCLWQQQTTCSSFAGVFCVLAYLASILTLHVTTPALFAVEIFNSTTRVNVSTVGLPMLSSDIALSGPQSIANGLTANVQTLTNLPYLRSLATVGLDGATLYDVLAPDNMADNTSRTVLGTGTAEVIAHTFQVDCGYIPNVSAESFDWNATTGIWNITLSGQQGLHTHMLLPPMQGIVGSLYSPDYLESSVIFYSTIPVLDANGNTAPQINPPSAPDGAAQSLQLFGCIHTLVPQTGVVDAQTGKLISLDNAGMTRRPSPVWAPLNDTDLLPGRILGDGQLLMTPSGFIEAPDPSDTVDRTIYLGSPITNYQSGATLTPVAGLYLNYPDFFVLSDLGLAVRGINNTVTEAAQSITLASFEASLAKLLASMFWIVGHVEPSYELTSLASNQTFNTTTALVKGQTVVQEIFSQARLNTACGLGASTMLLLISLQYLQFRSDSRDGVRINGTDLLHGIWLYRHHPELATLMGRVENPTDENLRAAGMVSVRLVDRNELNRSMYYAEQRYSVLKTKDDGHWVGVHDASK